MTATGPQTAPPAKVMFDAMDNENFLTCEMGDKLLVLCGIDLDKPGEWPVGDVTFDPYDSSFEFKGVTPGFTITREQWASCAALGFSRCWICYTDGTERYVSSGFLAEGLKAGHRGPSLDNDKRELARERAARVEAERQRDEATVALGDRAAFIGHIQDALQTAKSDAPTWKARIEDRIAYFRGLEQEVETLRAKVAER